MTTSSQSFVKFAGLDLSQSVLTKAGVSLATLPWLATVVGARALANSLQAAGVLSEEIFRGDRLPLLDLDQPQDASEPPESLI